MKYRSWHQHSFGFLSDGSRIMLVTVREDYPGRRNFPAVLVCRPDGLYRLWRTGRNKLLARLRVGDIPRGSRMLWFHELPLDFEQWAELDMDGIIEIEKRAAQRRVVQDKKASDALGRVFQKEGEGGEGAD